MKTKTNSKRVLSIVLCLVMCLSLFPVTAFAELTCTVSFDTNGGGTIDDMEVVSGEKAEKPEAPVREGYSFDGWYADAELSEVFDFETALIVEDITVYAGWTENVPAPAVTFTLSTAVDGGNGTISEGKTELAENSVETVIFTPDEGYEIDKVTVNGEEAELLSNELNVTMDSDKSIVVTYKEIVFELPETEELTESLDMYDSGTELPGVDTPGTESTPDTEILSGWITADFERVDSQEDIITGSKLHYMFVAKHLDDDGNPVYTALSPVLDNCYNIGAPLAVKDNGILSTDWDYDTSGPAPLMFYIKNLVYDDGSVSDYYYYLQNTTSTDEWITIDPPSIGIRTTGSRHDWYFGFNDDGTGLYCIVGYPNGNICYLSLSDEYTFFVDGCTYLPSGCELYLYRQVCEHTNREYTEAVPATCTSTGNIGYYYCPDCLSYHRTDNDEKIASIDVYLPPLAHSYVDGVCSECGQVQAVLYTTYVATKRNNNYPPEYKIQQNSEYMLLASGIDGLLYAVGVNAKNGGREAIPVDIPGNYSSTNYTEYKIRNADIDTFLMEEHDGKLAFKGKKGYLGYRYSIDGSEVTGILTTGEYLDGNTVTAGIYRNDYAYFRTLNLLLTEDESGNYYFAFVGSKYDGESFVPFVTCSHRDGGTAVENSAVTASCASAGIGTVYKCNLDELNRCNAPYFTDVSTITNPLQHNFVDGVCTGCGKTVETESFVLTEYPEWDKKSYALVASYDGKNYAMGLNASEKGYNAVEVTVTDGKFESDTAHVNIAATEDNCNLKLDGGYLALTDGRLITSPRCDVNIEARWHSSTGSINNITDGYTLCLITNDGEPYFGVMKTSEMDDSNSAAIGFYEKLCKHQLVPYFEAAEPDCVHNGMNPVWKCELCGYFFADENGDELIGRYEWDIREDEYIILSPGHIDENNDDICERCGAPMPSYQKVSSTAELVAGGKYLLVAEIGGQTYAMGKTVVEYTIDEEPIIAMTGISSAPVSPEADGTIKYMTAERNGAMHMIFGQTDVYAFEDFLRYSVTFRKLDDDGKPAMAGLMAVDGLDIIEGVEAKYGFYANENSGGVVLGSMYTANWTEDPGTICAVDDNGTVKFITNYGSEAAYLYRLVEKKTATVNDISISYTVEDKPVNVTINASIDETDYNTTTAGQVTCITNVCNAVQNEVIEEQVAAAAEAGYTDVTVNVGANVELVNYYRPDDGDAVSYVLYDITPSLSVVGSDGTVISTVELRDSQLNGEGMTVTLYTGSVCPAQVVHEKRDGTYEYFYYEWSEEVMNEGKNPFRRLQNPIWDDEWNYLGSEYAVTFTVTEFSNIYVYDTPIEEQESGRTPGDINGDGDVSVKDVVLLMRCIAGDSVELNTGAADVNGDGDVSVKDVVLLMRYIAGDQVTLK